MNIKLEKIKKTSYFAIDTETTSLNVNEAKLVGISIATEKQSACYIPLRHGETITESNDLFSFNTTEKYKEKQLEISFVLKELLPILKDKDIKKSAIISNMIYIFYQMNMGLSLK